MAKAEKTIDELLMEKRDSLQAQIDKLDADNMPLRDQIDELQRQQGVLDSQLAPLLDQWRPIKDERFRLANELGKVARGLGGKSTSDSNA